VSGEDAIDGLHGLLPSQAFRSNWRMPSAVTGAGL
jgi:hypothetical protein